MSRWWLLSIPLVLALGLFGLVRWLDRPVDLPELSPPAIAAAPAPIEPPAAEPAPLPAGTMAVLTGSVQPDGAPVESAEVVARGAQTQRLRTDQDGNFRLEVSAP